MAETKVDKFEEWLKEHNNMINILWYENVLDTFYDAYIIHRQLKTTINFLTKEGRITFNYYDNQKTDMVVIYVVNVINQRTGVFSRLLHKIAEDASINTICVACIESFAMDDLLTKINLGDKKFIGHACDSYWRR